VSQTALSIGIAMLIWGSFIWKLRSLRWWPRDTIQRSFCGALLALGLAMTVLIPPIYRGIDRVMGIPNVARLLGNCLGVVSTWSFQPVITRLLRYQARGRGVLDSMWLMVGTVGVMILLFGRMNIPQSAPADFQERYGAAPYVAEYRIVLFVYIGLALYNLFVLSLRNGEVIRNINQAHRRLWARLQTVGWGLGTAYAANECVYVLLRRTRFARNVAYDGLLASVLLCSFLILVLSGGPIELAHWVGQYRSLRQLFPLWRDLYRAMPQIALNPPPSERADRLAICDVSFRLYRRVTEIRDGMMALQPYIREPLGDAQSGCGRLKTEGDESTEAAREAARIAEAIVAKRLGKRASQPRIEPLVFSDASLEDEVRHLVRVARAYRQITERPPRGRQYISNTRRASIRR
jgi:hypothetical protein